MARGIGNTRLPEERRQRRCRSVPLPMDIDILRLARALTALYVLVWGTMIVYVVVKL